MRKESILLVDDEEIILNTLSIFLHHQNYDVTMASTGEEAISLLTKSHFDLLVTDLAMCGIDGIQVLKEVKKISSLIGVIILTGYGDMTSAIDALRLGADDYLLKPCDSEELLIRIERYFEKQDALRKVILYEEILPVCMYCKSIRDDKGTEPGKGSWLKMEEYLHTKSGTAFSHTFCPKCQTQAEKDMLGD